MKGHHNHYGENSVNIGQNYFHNEDSQLTGTPIILKVFADFPAESICGL